MARIYTKTGDKGDTGLVGGSRVSKRDPRMAAIGDVDEANAAIGVAIAICEEADVGAALTSIQNDLFGLGAELATPAGSSHFKQFISEVSVQRLEQQIDAFEAGLEPLANFILPGGTECAARLHLARTVSRRAERSVVAIPGEEMASEFAVTYLNRLSDLLFVLARTVNHRAGVQDVKWTQGGQND